MSIESTSRTHQEDPSAGEKPALGATVEEFFSGAIETLSRARQRVYSLPTHVSRDGKNIRKPQAIANFNEWIAELDDLSQNVQFKLIVHSPTDEVARLFDDRIQKLEDQQVQVEMWPGVKVDSPPRGKKQERAFLGQRLNFLRISKTYILEAIAGVGA